MVKKCSICIVGSWISGLSAIAWGAVAALDPFGFVVWLRVVCGFVGVIGIGFLVFQPPFLSCPRCVKLNKTP
jgi:hypothetical protein